METALSQRQLDLDRFDMLPRIAAEAGYEGRSNVNASSSESIETGTQSLEPSTSQGTVAMIHIPYRVCAAEPLARSAGA